MSRRSPAVHSPTTGVYPLAADIEAHLQRLLRKHPRLVRLRRVTDSVQGRPILAATITDPALPARDKQHVLVVAGQHGDEESGRLVALALADWLLTKPAAETLRNQKIVIMPCVNPDGAETDSHPNADGVFPNRDHGPGGARTPEGQSVEIVANDLQPDVFVDLHAAGGTGCGVDMVLFPWAKPYTEDEHLLHIIAADMAAAGERAGIPQMTFPLTWPGWSGPGPNAPSTTLWHYRRFKSLVFLTENTEHNDHAYPLRHRVRAGLAKLKALLAWGNRRHPKLRYPGYPTMLAGGMFHRGVVALGKTTAARRASRVAIWRNVTKFDRLDYHCPQEAKRKIIELEYSGDPLPAGAGIQTFARGKLDVASATLDGRRLRKSETSGYYSFHDSCSTFTVVAIPRLEPRAYHIEIAYR